MAAPKAKFMFDADFSAPVDGPERPIPPGEHAMRLAEAEAKGFRDGYATAEKERVAEAERRTAIAFEQIADAVTSLARRVNEAETRLKTEAVEIAVAVGRKLAPALIAREPLAEISALAAECLRQLTASPHVAIRVNEALHEAARERLEDIARGCGFAGRLIVIADPDVAPGDCRIDWADGGVVRDRAAIEAAIGEAVERYLVAARVAAAPEFEETET